MTESDYMKSEAYKTISETLWNLGFDDHGIWLIHLIISRELKWRHDGE